MRPFVMTRTAIRASLTAVAFLAALVVVTVAGATSGLTRAVIR